MIVVRYAWVMFRHGLLLWRAGQVRFRLETFGIYYPYPPYAAPWWRIAPRSAWLLMRQVRAYTAWVMEMKELRSHGPTGWWAQHTNGKGIPHEWPY